MRPVLPVLESNHRNELMPGTKLRHLLRLVILIVSLPFASTSVQADVTFEEQSERLQLIYAHLMDYRVSTALRAAPDKPWYGGLDLVYLPTVDNRVGTKKEEIDPPKLLARPRVRWHHENGISLGLSWIPPITLQGYTLNLVGAEMAYAYDLKQWSLFTRATYSDGNTKGPITDKDETDRFFLSRSTWELGLTRELYGTRPYAGFGRGHLSTRLEIEVDGVVMEVIDHSYPFYYFGVNYTWLERWQFNLEQSFNEDFVRFFGISVGTRF